jgi:dihydrofolate synthase/folylpolyglutamate synthase
MDVFYREWERRAPGETRDLGRARALADVLGLLEPGVPVLTVVGSKGKGTAATYASAFLGAAGLRVCTVTSPALRSDRERIRIDGKAVSRGELAILADALERAIAELPPPSGGYLSPSGLFTIGGVLHARGAGADAIVLEAGMGGRSDEAGLFPPDVAAITPIFREHAGVLGDTPAEIAAEKLGVAGPATRVVSAPQSAEVAAVLGAVEFVGPGAAGIPADLLPAGLGRAGAELGVVAARRLPGVAEPPAGSVREVLSSVVLPGRLSWHDVPGSATRLLVGSAVDGTGIAAALAAAREAWGTIDHVVVCLPDHKDLDGAITELDALPVTFVRLPLPHLRFTRPLPPGWDTVGSHAITPESLATLGHRVLVLGTVYFTGFVLGVVDAGTERLYVTSASRRPS